MSTKLEPRRYLAEILYHTMNTNGQGNPELRLAVLPRAGTDGQPLPPGYSPTPIIIFMTITANTMQVPQTLEQIAAGDLPRPGWVLETLRHIGFTGNDLATLDPESDIPANFAGRKVTILGSEDEYKGKKRIRWNIVRESETKPVETNQLKHLSARFNKILTVTAPIDKTTDAPF